jgi:hypothetical protein
MTSRVSKKIAAELESIRRKHRGVLRPVDVVAFAENPETYLHDRFEWDDTAAASAYRIEQAKLLIRCTVDVVEEGRAPVRMYVSLLPERKEGDSYRSLADVMRDPRRRKMLLAQALREANSWRARYERLVELVPIFKAIDATKKKL